jgi:hypothetical protein
MKLLDLKELIKKSMLEVSPKSGAMTPEEEKMVAGYEEEEANKYALDKEEPMEEGTSDIPDDIRWSVSEVFERVDDYAVEVALEGYSPTTGKEYTAYTTAVEIGDGYEWDEVYDVEEVTMKEEKKGHYVTLKAKDGSHKSTLTNLPNHADQTYSDALRSIERLKAVDGRKGKKYIYYVSDKDGNPITQGKEIEEASVILNRDEVYAKYAPLVKQYMASGLGRHAAISKAQNVLAKEYGATPLNIQSTISDYFDDQDRNATYANEDVLREADEIVAAYAEKKTLNEEMHGGYLELFEMNPNFEEGVSMLLAAWEEWKEGPETEPEMVEEAKHDILAYLSSMMN